MVENQNGTVEAETKDPPAKESILEPEVNQISPDQVVAEQKQSNEAEVDVVYPEVVYMLINVSESVAFNFVLFVTVQVPILSKSVR